MNFREILKKCIMESYGPSEPSSMVCKRIERALFEAGYVMTPREPTAPEMLDALKAITNHFADVMGGPLISDRVKFVDGVEGIPTIKAARAAIAKAEGQGQS